MPGNKRSGRQLWSQNEFYRGSWNVPCGKLNCNENSWMPSLTHFEVTRSRHLKVDVKQQINISLLILPPTFLENQEPKLIGILQNHWKSRNFPETPTRKAEGFWSHQTCRHCFSILNKYSFPVSGHKFRRMTCQLVFAALGGLRGVERMEWGG